MLDLFDCATLVEVVPGTGCGQGAGASAGADRRSRIRSGGAAWRRTRRRSGDGAERRRRGRPASGNRPRCSRAGRMRPEASELHAERREAEQGAGGNRRRRCAAHMEEKRRTVLAEIEARAIAYLRLRAGMLAGETALRLYRERHRSAMMQRASAAFSAISGGDYDGLSTQAEKGEEFLIANAAAAARSWRATFPRARAFSSIWRCASPAITRSPQRANRCRSSPMTSWKPSTTAAPGTPSR